jgi:hypothetical protein
MDLLGRLRDLGERLRMDDRPETRDTSHEHEGGESRAVVIAD